MPWNMYVIMNDAYRGNEIYNNKYKAIKQVANKNRERRQLTSSGKEWGHRGMSSAKASKVKLKGHSDEKYVAPFLNLDPDNPEHVIPGTDKADFKLLNNETISLKSSSNPKGRSQFCLYSLNSKKFEAFKSDTTDKMKACIAIFPKLEERENYINGKLYYKKELQLKMRILKNHLEDKDNYIKFLRILMFHDLKYKLVDYLMIKDDYLNFHIFYRSDVEYIFINNTIISNSKARNKTQMDDLKVIIKAIISTSNKVVNLIDNEIRTTKSCYRNFLAIGNKTNYLQLLIDKSKSKKIIEFENNELKLITYGIAIDRFDDYLSN